MSEEKKHPAVGIDLGTTFSAVAYLDASGRPETIRSAEGDLTTPSAVFFDKKAPLVGIEAVEAGLLEPERLALYAKRDVGEDAYEKKIRGEELPPEVLQALVLRKLKEDAELKLGTVQKAVVTVPAFFNEPCRKATQDAGRLAGLDVLDIINEPTAAAITYGVQQGFLSESGTSDKLERVLVYDLGGGTFDVTVMEIDKGNYHTIATAGDVYLGGVDWDRRVVDFIAEKFIEEHAVDPRDDPQGEQELIRKANQTKHALTQRESVAIAFAHDGLRLRTELSQSDFATLCEDLVERTLMTVGLVLDDSSLTWTDLTRLILVGGSTRMPMIREELEKRSGFELDRSLSPDEAVSHGAALYAGMLLGHAGEHAKVSVTNVNSHDLGVLAVDPKTGDPRRQIMIPRNSSLPCQKEIRFRTHVANQANVKIEVVEGGDDRGVNATKIGKCIVDDLPPNTPKGTCVDVVFDYGQDGRLKVNANLPEIERNVQLTLDRAAGLSDEEIESWRQRIDNGLVDPDPQPIGVIDDDNELLPADDDEDIPFAVINESPEPAKMPTIKAVAPVTRVTPAPVIKPAGQPKLQPKVKPVVADSPIPKIKPSAKPVVKPAAAVVKPVTVVQEDDPIPEATIVNPVKPGSKSPVKKLVKKPASRVSPLATNKDGGAAPVKPAAKPIMPKSIKPKVIEPKAVTPKPVAPAATTPRTVAPAKPIKPAAGAKPVPVKKLKPKPAGPESDGPKIGPPTKKLAKPVAQKKPAGKGGPKLDLGIGDDAAKVKPSDADFSALMSLGGAAPKKSKTPVIITSDDPPSKKKKGDWKSRGKQLSSDEDEE